VVGTIPIGIDIAASDIDIVCEVHDRQAFVDTMCENFGGYEDFNVRISDGDSVVCGFSHGGEKFEIYGSPTPSLRSESRRHMIVEARLLDIMGPEFRNGIVELKNRGMKTEPAFARMLGLDGDPYRAVLELEEYTDEQLAAKIPVSIF
jgi:hypothetical protein